MREKFFYYRGWYYPVDSVSFRINNHDKSISMFHLSEDKAIEIFTGQQALRLAKFLDQCSIILEAIVEEEEAIN